MISLFVTEGVCTNETIIHVLSHQPLFLSLPGILHLSCCLSFIPARHPSPQLYTPPLSLGPVSPTVHPLSHLFSSPRVNLSLSVPLPLSPFFFSASSTRSFTGLFLVGGCFNESVLSPSLRGWTMIDAGRRREYAHMQSYLDQIRCVCMCLCLPPCI